MKKIRVYFPRWGKTMEENKNRMSQYPSWGADFCPNTSLLQVFSGPCRPQPQLLPIHSRFHNPIFNYSLNVSPPGKFLVIFQDSTPQLPILSVTVQPLKNPVHTLGHCGHWLCGCFP